MRFGLRALAPLIALSVLASVTVAQPSGAAEESYQFAAFTGNEEPDGRAGIFLHDLATGRYELVDPLGYGTGPVSWAPDGSGFVFRDKAIEGGGISLYDVAARTKRTVIAGDADQPVVAPTGDLVVYLSTVAQEQYETRVVGIDGTGDRPIFSFGGTAMLYSSQPWSPDGSRLVATGLFGFDFRTLIVDVASGLTTELDLPADAGNRVTWSPAGDMLAVPSKTDGVILFTPDGTIVGRLPGRRPSELVWSPDGSRLAGTAFVGDSIKRGGVYIWDIDRRDGPQQQFTDDDDGVLNTSVASWSSDGALIAFYQVMRFGPSKASTVNVVTRDVTVHGEYSWPSLRPAAPCGPKDPPTVPAESDRPADDQILRLYRAAFGRPPDASGFSFWTAEYRGGRTLDSIVAAFIASPEFRSRYGSAPSDTELVDAMYRNVLGRPGDSAGTEFWLGQLANGMTTIRLLRSFADSPENIDATGTSPPLTSQASQVLRLYRAAFGRLPDASGFAYWVDQACRGRSMLSIATGFASSPEFAARYGASLTDEVLIAALYRNVLDRDGDAGGVRFWLQRRADGMTVAELLVAFADSPENVERTGTRQ